MLIQINHIFLLSGRFHVLDVEFIESLKYFNSHFWIYSILILTFEYILF